MNKRYVLVCDSHASIPTDLVESYNIKLIPSPIIIDDHVFHDTVNITDLEVYEQMRNGVLPKTSMPEFGVIRDTLESLSKEYEHVFYVVMSSGFSGTYQSALLAKEDIGTDNITIIDSKKICFPHGLLMLTLAQRLENGLDLNQVENEVKNIQNEVNELFMIDDLFHLKRLGRMGTAGAVLGTTLKIKPLFTFKDGIIDVVKKTRTAHKAKDYMLEEFLKSSVDDSQPIFLATSNEPELTFSIKEIIKEKYPKIEIREINVNPVITAHTGLGVISIGWLSKRD